MYDQVWGDRLRMLRILNGYGQEQLAAKINIPLGTYSQWENKGRQPRDINTYSRLGELFSVEPSMIQGLNTHVSGPIFWYPRSYELRQADLIRGLIREELPKIMDVKKCVTVNLNREGTLFIFNDSVIIVSAEDLESCFSKVIPEEMIEKSDVNLGVGPKGLLPLHMEQLAHHKIISPEIAKFASRKLAILISSDEPMSVDWIESFGKALSLIPETSSRHAVASEFILNSYPKMDKRLQAWLTHELSSVGTEPAAA